MADLAKVAEGGTTLDRVAGAPVQPPPTRRCQYRMAILPDAAVGGVLTGAPAGRGARHPFRTANKPTSMYGLVGREVCDVVVEMEETIGVEREHGDGASACTDVSRWH